MKRRKVLNDSFKIRFYLNEVRMNIFDSYMSQDMTTISVLLLIFSINNYELNYKITHKYPRIHMVINEWTRRLDFVNEIIYNA